MSVEPKTSAELFIRPVVAGVSNSERVIIGQPGQDDLLALTKGEFNELQRLGDGNVTVADFLFKHLGGQDALSFKASLDLLAKLYKHDFIEPSSVDLRHKLDELAKARKILSASPWRKWSELAKSVLNVRLLKLNEIQTNSFFGRVAAALIHPACLGAMTAVVIVAAIAIPPSLTTLQTLTQNLFAHPEQLLLSLIGTLAVCLSVPPLVQAWVLGAMGQKGIGLDLNLTGFLLPRLHIRDDASFLMQRAECMRYHAFGVLLPWTIAGFAWILSEGQPALTSGFVALGFVAAGFMSLCPLIRGPMIKWCEANMVELHLIPQAQKYLSKMIFRDVAMLFPKNVKLRKAGATDKAEQHLDVWMALYASTTILWLYVGFLAMADATLSAVPEMLLNIRQFESVSNVVASALLAFTLTTVAVAVAVKFLAIVVQNIFALAGDPLVRARRNIQTYKLPRLKPSEAITRFLRDIPILSHLSEDMVVQLTKHLRFAEYKANQLIVRQGDKGEHFYILALGTAEIFVANRDGTQKFIDTLRPADTFGEIALLHDVPRQASVVARNDVRLLILAKTSFDHIFPKDSEFRVHLTSYINRSRMVHESRALSYLTPKQITAFLRKAHPVEFKAGDTIIEEGSRGNAAFIIETGTARVVHGASKDETIAELKRGDLFGMISLLRDIPRTATVLAASDVTCLKIDKQDFLNLCMQNLLVGALISELSEQQMNELQINLQVAG